MVAVFIRDHNEKGGRRIIYAIHIQEGDDFVVESRMLIHIHRLPVADLKSPGFGTAAPEPCNVATVQEAADVKTCAGIDTAAHLNSCNSFPRGLFSHH